MSSTTPLPSTSMSKAIAPTSTPAAPFPATSKAAASTSTPAALLPTTSTASTSTPAMTSAVDERQRSLPIEVGECSVKEVAECSVNEVAECSVKEVTPKKFDGASDDDSGSSSDDSGSGDEDKLDIPPGQSVMDYLASLSGLDLRERARILSKVGIEAKRKEIAGFVGDTAAAQMSHLEVKQKFNQLDNWRFTQVGFPNVPPPQFVAEFMREKEKEKQREKQEKEKEKKKAERENVVKIERERVAKEKAEKEADKENQHPNQSKGKGPLKGGRAKRKCAEITEQKIKEEAEKDTSEVKIVSDVREALKELSDFEATSESSSDDEWTAKRPNRKQKRKPRKVKKNSNAKKLNKTIIFQHDPSHNPFIPPVKKEAEEEEEFDGFGDEEIEEAEALLGQTCARYDSLSIVDKKDEKIRFGVLPEIRIGTKREILMEKESRFAAALSEGLKLLDDQDQDDSAALVESITNMAEEMFDDINPNSRELDDFAIDLEDSHEFEYCSDLNEIDFTESEDGEEDDADAYPHEKAISREQKKFARMLNIGVQKRPARKAASTVNNYADPEESDIDEEEQLLIPCIWCPDQQHKYGICPLQPDRLPNFIPNSKVDDGYLSLMSRAEASLPANLSIRESRIAGADKGVWYKYCGNGIKTEKSPLPRGTIFGPYEGRLLSSEEEADRSGTAWEVRLSNGNLVYIDGNDDAEANWLKYVNCSRTAKEQNMYAFDFKGAIYYLTIRQVLPGTELLVYYGDAYANTLNIDVKPNPDKYDLQHCDICDSFFADEESLSRHIQSEHDGREVWPCDKCSFEGKSEKAILRHSRDNHPVSFLFHCESCDYKTNHSNHMENHRRTHDEKHPFVCSICTKGFTEKGALNRHARIHSGERPYKCEECGADFTQSCNLSTHRKNVHEKLLQFKCDTCGKRFAQSAHLERHIRTHTGEKPFACSFCKASFSRSCDLKGHIRTHTGEKPFVCSKCEASYAQSSHLRDHERRKHAE